MTMTTETQDTQEEQELLLAALEATYARGLRALTRRDELLTELHHSGLSLQRLANLLNAARATVPGTRMVTRYAVHAAIRRLGKR